VTAGRLERVLPEWHARADPIHLVYPWQRFVPPKLRAFIDVVSDEPGAYGWIVETGCCHPSSALASVSSSSLVAARFS
jgi:hypothetical protein